MAQITIEVTKLKKILTDRGLTQKNFRELIQKTNNGEAPALYILGEIINGKRKNYTIDTLRPIKRALNVSYDDLIDD